MFHSIFVDVLLLLTVSTPTDLSCEVFTAKSLSLSVLFNEPVHRVVVTTSNESTGLGFGKPFFCNAPFNTQTSAHPFDLRAVGSIQRFQNLLCASASPCFLFVRLARFSLRHRLSFKMA